MAKLCEEDNIAMTPYSALAGGRLSKHPGETSKRLEEDSYARLKYDATAAQDAVIIDRVAELADKKEVSMTEVSLVLDGELRETQTTDYFSKHRRSDCAVRELTAR